MNSNKWGVLRAVYTHWGRYERNSPVQLEAAHETARERQFTKLNEHYTAVTLHVNVRPFAARESLRARA